MGSEIAAPSEKLHLLFFPFMTPGHMIPMVDMARLIAARGVHATVVTTPANAVNIRTALDRSADLGHHIDLVVIPFPPSEETGIPAGAENLSAVPAAGFNNFITALFRFQVPIEALVRDLRPDCIVSDSLFTWTADLALAHNIPRLIFHGAGAFPLYVMSNIVKYLPLQDSFLMDGLPDKIQMYKAGMPELLENLTMLQLMGEAEAKSYGVVVNTYREMEPSYVDFYKTQNPAGNKAWCVGPVSLCVREADDRAERGEAPAAKDRILAWLDSKTPGSVVYVCFGSLCHFSAAQLREIAIGLESSGQAFLWVVRKEAEGDGAEEEEWMPEGFEGRVGERGMVVRGWAPQVVLLGHGAVGWFVTHCGWNSLQEAVVAGLPVVTWPLFHEQFINQELLVEVMRVGVRMWEGFRRNRMEEEKVLVSAEEIAAVLGRVMGGGEEMEGMKARAREYGEAARKAVEEGGSTYEDISNLIADLMTRRSDGKEN